MNKQANFQGLEVGYDIPALPGKGSRMTNRPLAAALWMTGAIAAFTAMAIATRQIKGGVAPGAVAGVQLLMAGVRAMAAASHAAASAGASSDHCRSAPRTLAWLSASALE